VKTVNNKQSLLVAQSGPLNGERWSIREVLVIGRDPTCTIVIPDRQVSRFHARISVEGDETILEDLGSKNGLFINDKQIVEPVKLQDGELFSVALVQQFAFLNSDATLPLEPISMQRKDRWGKIFMEVRSRRVWVGDKEIDPPLSVPQFRLLQILYNHPGQVVSRAELEVEVWGDEGAVGISEQALDALIRRLRERISALDPGHQYLVTLRGHGVRLDNPNQ
jgi:DNA-binding winged helix-turn-helix (wHTH) protein